MTILSNSKTRTDAISPKLPSPPVSEISTNFRCDNCGILINKVNWMRCNLCKEFHLCDECAETPYHELPDPTRDTHQQLHQNTIITSASFGVVSVEQAEAEGAEVRLKKTELEYKRIIKEKKIENDYDMSIVIDTLIRNHLPTDDKINSLIVKYQLSAHKRNIHVLSLDGGGVRGYMPIKLLSELIVRKHSPNIAQFNLKDLQHRPFFLEAQKKFTQNFDYFVGTSTGALIAFSLATDCNILDLKEIYSDAPHYFKRNRLGPWIYSKYDPSVIHQKIDDIIDDITFPIYGKISSKHATLLDVRNLLNPQDLIDEKRANSMIYRRGNSMEFDDNSEPGDVTKAKDQASKSHRVPREKILLITAYNTTHNTIMVFNTSYANHWRYRIADVLKATMAAPTYFPPHKVYQGVKTNGQFIPGKTSELFIDGGMFANDPELAALWAARMQWKKPANYHLLSVGTGCYTSTLSSSTWGGYLGWIFNKGFLVNTLMDATRSFTEIVGGNLAKFHNMRRMKLNYKTTKEMDLDDPNFVRIFDQEWEDMQNGDEFNAFLYFYEKYIKH